MDTLMTEINATSLEGIEELVLDPNVRWTLRREWDPKSKTFDYVLIGPKPDRHRIILDERLGRTLASHWTQTENGTFVGRHNMDWIIRHLSMGEAK